MLQWPSRIDGLIKRLEAGEEPTQAEMRRLEILQQLDLAKLGEDFAREVIQAEEAHTQMFREAAA